MSPNLPDRFAYTFEFTGKAERICCTTVQVSTTVQVTVQIDLNRVNFGS